MKRRGGQAWRRCSTTISRARVLRSSRRRSCNRISQRYGWRWRRPTGSFTTRSWPDRPRRRSNIWRWAIPFSKALSLFYSESGNFERAAECAAGYASKTHADPGAYARAIQLYLQAGKPKPAIDLARTALAAENRAEVRYLLGKAYEMDGQPVDSVHEMRAAIGLNPYEESYYFELARDLLRHNSAQEAIQVLEDGRKVLARSAQIELTLAQQSPPGCRHLGGQRRSLPGLEAGR
jgi:predicted Zn-dependent protease